MHKVCDAIFELRENYIHWPENSYGLAQKFFDIARMPSVCGCVDGTHVLVNPPIADEASSATDLNQDIIELTFPQEIVLNEHLELLSNVFYALSTGLRVKNMDFAAQHVYCSRKRWC